VYHDRAAWQKFLRLLFMSLGIGFTVSGIVFFFAYNWADLHKFAKLGLTQGLLLVTTILALLPGIHVNTRNMILTGAAVLVGVLFAVFGQIYQTGANAYDFFLGWTIFVTLWVVIARFAPLWLLYLLLVNTTFVLYTQQVARDWSEILVLTVLFALNTTALLTAIFLSDYRKIAKAPRWFLNTVALAAVTFATMGIIIGIFGRYQAAFLVLVGMAAIVYALGIWHGLQVKSGFYLSIIAFSLIIILSALLIKISSAEIMFFTVGLFIIGSVTLTIKTLMDLQKKWTNEQ
jgi:uncharacterized membrane protein